MKVLKNLSLMVLLALAFAGCRGKSSQLADFNKQLYAPEYASGFKIERADGRQSVLVSVMNPWQGADSVTTRLFISRNGEPVPEGFDGQVLEGDAQRIVAMSSTHIAMLDAIGETARVVGVSGLDYISNPDIQARRDSIGDVGYEGNINYELLLSLDPDLVLLFGVNGASAMESKLKELGIPFIVLMVAMLPVAKVIVGTSIGNAAMIVMLVIAAAPYVARMVESSLKEVSPGVIEAAQSMGTSDFGIIRKVMIPEAKPALIVGAVISTVTVLGYSAMAATIGGGGLGGIAIIWGHQRSHEDIIWVCVLLIVLIVQVIQELGMLLARKTDRRVRK